MTGSSDTRAGEIELNFCKRCGISIPFADIDSGRARAAPGGYVCVGCIYQQRDADLSAASEPPAARRAGAGAGTRVLVTLALLYVVGATSFLLVRELKRPPALRLPPIAAPKEVEAVARRVDELDTQVRTAIGQLLGNDKAQGGALTDLATGLQRLEDGLAAQAQRDQDLASSVLEVGHRTIGLDRDIKEILRDVGLLGEKLDRQPAPVAPAPAPPVTVETQPADPAPADPAEAERARQIEDFSRQLLDKRADKQSRFNAAVQLGELKDPRAVEPLVQALKDDSYDLVRRAAAWSLGMLGRDALRAVPSLIEQMTDKEEYVGYMCERALGEITKAATGAAVNFGFDPTMSPQRRRGVQREWEQWWEKNRPTLLPGGA